MANLRVALVALSAVSLGACSINVDDHNPDYAVNHYSSGSILESGRRLVTVEQLAEDERVGAAVVDHILARGREQGCSVVSADAFRRLTDSTHGRGVRVRLSCPVGVAF